MNPRGATPMTSWLVLSMRMERPTMFAAPPNCRCQRSKLMITVRGAPNRSSSGRNGATQDRHHASCREHVAGAVAHPDPHRLGIARLGRHRDGPRRVGRDVLEARRALLPVEEISRRNRHPRLAGPEIALVQRGQPLRRLERKRPQQQRVHDAENRGARANAERQRDDHQQGEPRPFRERAQGERHVAPNRFHWHSLLQRRAVAPAVGRGSLRIGWPRAL